MIETPAISSAVIQENGTTTEGVTIFARNCSGCHYADKHETKIGPGLKGLFERESLPGAGRPVTGESIRKQLATPFRAMPPFPDLRKGDIKALLALRRLF